MQKSLLANLQSVLSSDLRSTLQSCVILRRPDRDQIASFVGWGRSKTDSLLLELQNSGLIQRYRDNEAGQGRPPYLYAPTKSLGIVVGIELGVDTDHIVVTDLRQNILETVSFSNERPTADPIAEIVQRVVRTIETPGYSLKEIIGIGLSAAIQFNSHNASGRIVSFTNECANLIGSQLTKELNIHVYVGRPQVMIAYDTHWRTLIADKTSFVSAFFAHNVGISHFVEGKPYGGSSGLGADLGHLKIPFSNRTCYCGRSGCFRTIVSYEGVAQTLSERAKLIPQLASRYTRSPLGSAIDSPESAVREVVQLARNGNSFGVDLVATLGEQIGSTLSSAVSLFHPSALSIHSCYVDAGPVFTDPVTIALRRSCLELYTENLEIDFYGLSPQNIARGSASFAIIRSMEELVSYQEDTRKR